MNDVVAGCLTLAGVSVCVTYAVQDMVTRQQEVEKVCRRLTNKVNVAFLKFRALLKERAMHRWRV